MDDKSTRNCTDFTWSSSMRLQIKAKLEMHQRKFTHTHSPCRKKERQRKTIVPLTRLVFNFRNQRRHTEYLSNLAMFVVLHIPGNRERERESARARQRANPTLQQNYCFIKSKNNENCYNNNKKSYNCLLNSGSNAAAAPTMLFISNTFVIASSHRDLFAILFDVHKN